MSRTDFEKGFYRLYLIIWTVLVLSCLFMVSQRDFRTESAVVLVSAFVGPWFLMKMGRWVYRGFVPNS